MAGTHSNDVGLDRLAEQGQVADDVDHLVPDKFLRVPQRLGRQHRVITDDDGVLQAAAFDKAVFKKKFQLLEISELIELLILR